MTYSADYRCSEKLSIQRRKVVGPIKFRPDSGSIVIKHDLGTSFVDDHALSSEFAVIFVETNVTDMRNRPAIRRWQVSVETQECLDTCARCTKEVKINANPVRIPYHFIESAVWRQRQANFKGQVCR